MTSITHAASPARMTSRPAATARSSRVGVDSKALRLGLGVAIAAVLAGDVYAVLRAPVSEGRASSVGRSAAAPAVDEGGRGAASRSAASTPFGEAAYGAELAGRVVAVIPPAAGSRVSTAGAAAAGAPATSTSPVTPPSVSLAPGNPLASTVGVPTVTPATIATTSPETPTPPAAPSEPTLVQRVVQSVEEVPVVGGTVAPVVEQVVEMSPVPVAEVEAALTPVTDGVSVPASTTVGSVPSL